jgi:hypothetical protein
MLHRDLSSVCTLSTEDDMPQLTPSMKALARLGAQVRFRELTEHLAKLQSERANLLKLFPELGVETRSRPPAAPESNADSRSKKGIAPAARRRKASDAQRRAASEKMKQYWAKRRRDELLAEGQGVKAGDSGVESAANEADERISA